MSIPPYFPNSTIAYLKSFEQTRLIGFGIGRPLNNAPKDCGGAIFRAISLGQMETTCDKTQLGQSGIDALESKKYNVTPIDDSTVLVDWNVCITSPNGRVIHCD